MTDHTPRAWVGSLAAYNEGLLLGEWFDWDEIPDSPREWVEAIYEAGGFPESTQRTLVRASSEAREAALDLLAQRHEELWVFDHENFGAFLRREECSPAQAAEIGAVLAQVHHSEREAFDAYVDDRGPQNVDLDTVVEQFQDAYAGTFESAEDWAREYVETVGDLSPDSPLARYFDYRAYVEDARNDGITFEQTGFRTVHVYYPN